MMRKCALSLAAALLVLPAVAQEDDVGPSSPPAAAWAGSGDWVFGTAMPCFPRPVVEHWRVEITPQVVETGNLGVQYVEALDRYYVSTRFCTQLPGGCATGMPRENKVFVYDSAGNILLGEEFDQIPEAFGDNWGYRDMASDGNFIYGGWSDGLARHNLDGSGGVLLFAGSPPDPNVSTWRALAYDPSGDAGNGSLWTASFTSPLIEVSATTGALLNSFDPPVGNEWHLYGLAMDPITGNLWGYSWPDDGKVVEIDILDGSPTEGEMTGRGFWPACIPGNSTTPGREGCQVQGGLTLVPGGAGGSGNPYDLVLLAQAAPDSLSGYSLYCDECDACDMNCDDLINSFDIEPFLALLFDPKSDPCCGERGDIGSTGDTNGDGEINSFDIEPFLECLFGP